MNAWRKVEGVMGDRNISRKVKGRVLEACVIPACVYALETCAITTNQMNRLQVCENNWVRKIAGVKRVERRRLEELRQEIGLGMTITRKIERARMRWAGHVARMEEGRAPRRAMEMEIDGTRRRGRPTMRWRDAVEKVVNRMGEQRDWKMVARDRTAWKKLVAKI